MRSSIACIRCRRSKVKCVNNGVGTVCRSCENSGRECTYPSPITGITRRRESLSGGGGSSGYGETERRQRPRKSAHTEFTSHPASALRGSPRPLLDALDPKLLTPKIWEELFEIFQTHYSADLPFLHPPSFLQPLQNGNAQLPGASGSMSDDSYRAIRPPASEEFLLAFLALTARFHPTLVAHHSPTMPNRPSNAMKASEYYAKAANERIAAVWTSNRAQDIEQTQAILMLGLYDWGMCRGAKAWLAVGIAIRAAQSIGLQYEMELDDEPLSRSVALKAEAERMGVGRNRKGSNGTVRASEDRFIQQEICRRTFWSCYIMDRYLSSGKYRPQMLHALEVRIQLPASERSFLFAEKVRTSMLEGTDRDEVQNARQQSVRLGTGTPEPGMVASPTTSALDGNDDNKGRLQVGADEGLVSRYIKILEVYGQVVKWSCSGGRRTEFHPPWDARCEFYRLRKKCQAFKASLPRQDTLTPQNTQAHISMKTSTPYLLVHTVYLLCQIVLHREYVPFIPIRCEQPEGPLDDPIFPPEKFEAPPGFWIDSARECFKSAREIVDLVRTCQKWKVLVETPIVGFAIYTVAFTGVYCKHFPKMDPDGFLCTKDDAKSGESEGFEASQKALEMLGHLRSRLHMATGWFKTINHMHNYYQHLKADYAKNVQSLGSSSDGESSVGARNLPLREGGHGGGLIEFKLLERTLQDFGNLDDQDAEITDTSRPDSRTVDAAYDGSRANSPVKSEESNDRVNRGSASSQPPRSEGGSWSAINATPASPQGVTSIPPSTSNAQFRSYESYPQHSQPPAPTLGQPIGQPMQYSQQIGGFRPAFSEASSSIGPPPSLTSPAAQSAAESSSQPSPSYDRNNQQQPFGWSAQNARYAMQAPPPLNTYSNGFSQHSYPLGAHQQPQHSPYPASQGFPPPGQTQFSSAMQGVQPSDCDPMTQAKWLRTVPTRFGGDDIAAFVDGGEVSEWATLSATNHGYDNGWLTAVWGAGNENLR